MRWTRVRQWAIFAGLAAAMLAAASRLDVAGEKPYDIAVIPRASAVRWLSLGHPTLAADLFWLRAVQYIGEPQSRKRGWSQLYPAVDLVTDLDPRHGYAYQCAGVILGSVGRVEESNAILEKGMDRLPQRYVLGLLRAFNAFYYQGDWEAAGRFAERAARAPGAPARIRQNAVAYYVKGRRADAAVAFLEEARREAHDDESRKAIDEQLLQARFEAGAAEVDQAAGRYRRARGIGPLYPARLVETGFLAALPAEPFGGSWIFGEDRRARSTAHAYRFAPRPTRAQMGGEPGVTDEQGVPR
jgi:tetratricopeptide (TPR) repeat protein